MIHMFWPYVSEKVKDAVSEVLKTRWIGQGPKVEEVERKFKDQLGLNFLLECHILLGGKNCLRLAKQSFLKILKIGCQRQKNKPLSHLWPSRYIGKHHL